MQAKIESLTKKVKKEEQIIQEERSFRVMKRCAESEGDICECTGRVFYGEKYDRNQTLANNGSQAGLKPLDFNQMVKYPYLTRQWYQRRYYKCSFDKFYDGSGVSAYLVYSGKYQKQCFCELDALPPHSGEGKWMY